MFVVRVRIVSGRLFSRLLYLSNNQSCALCTYLRLLHLLDYFTEITDSTKMSHNKILAEVYNFQFGFRFHFSDTGSRHHA